MTRKRRYLAVVTSLLAVATGVALAQPGGPFRRQSPAGDALDDRRGVPDWKVDEHFKNDVFTFVRIQYDSTGGWYGGGGIGGMYQMVSMEQQPRRGRGGRGGGFGGGGFGGRGGYGWDRWSTDFPDSDLNFSFRLQQLTSLKVNPNPIHRRLIDPDLCDYPFIYIIEPGALSFSEEEGLALRRYLLNGGFLMVDDFWGDRALFNFLTQMKQRVFPEPQYEPEELKLDHEIFRCVYRLKEKPQVPSIHTWQWNPGVTWEDHGPGSETVHYLGINDDKGRLMAIICHNTDLGDGWEREGENEDYFHEFSEKKSYPMGINIVTYAMTH
jgi:Domain of unknown function (DUF4159)